MPEDLFPGVYIEEVSYRAKTIEGVRTFVLGFLLGAAASIALERLHRWCRRQHS